MKSILLTGGTGFVGGHVLNQLPGCVVTSRNRKKAKSKLGDSISDAIQWNPSNEELDLGDRKFDACINLMGESIADGRWTDEKKKRLRESRVTGTRRLVDALLRCEHPPEVMVAASAVGIYGDQGDQELTENSQHGEGFLADLCEEWEVESMRLAEHGVRVVVLRIGIVLGRDGGALEKMVPLFNYGLGGRLGSGKQWMPWVHVTDLARMISWLIETSQVSGPVNGVSPNPVRNSEFTKTLANQLGRYAILPVPRFALRIALGEFANSLFFSQRVIPAAAKRHDFEFSFPTIDLALKDALETNSNKAQ